MTRLQLWSAPSLMMCVSMMFPSCVSALCASQQQHVPGSCRYSTEHYTSCLGQLFKLSHRNMAEEGQGFVDLLTAEDWMLMMMMPCYSFTAQFEFASQHGYSQCSRGSLGLNTESTV